MFKAFESSHNNTCSIKSLNTQTTKHVCSGKRFSEKTAYLCLMKLNCVKLLESIVDTKELKANKLINT